MKLKTFKEYKQAIKEHYIFAKASDVSGILANPSPAQLRTFSQLLCDKGLNKREEEIFRLFFEAKEGEDLKKAIDRNSIDKFKPIISFLKGEKDSDNSIRVELAAIIVGFDKRPYVEFSKVLSHENVLNKKELISLQVSHIENKTEKSNSEKRKDFFFLFTSNKFALIFMILTALVSGFLASKFIFNEEQCMQWKNNQYEIVDCKTANKNSVEASEIIPLDKNLLDFKKVEVDSNTLFFKNSKAVLWYSKVNNQPEFFNSVGNGFHPETKKALKPVSLYIINKYVFKK
jgi:hypothetical protein